MGGAVFPPYYLPGANLWWSFPPGSDGKSICLRCGRPGLDPWVGKILWRRKWQPIPILLPGKFHGWRSLVSYSQWGRKESDTTERLHFTLNCGGGNEDKGDLPQKIPCLYCHSLCPQPCSRPPPTHAFAGGSWTPIGKSPVGSLFLSPGSWCTRFCCMLQESISQSYVSSGRSMVGLMVTSSKRT